MVSRRDNSAAVVFGAASPIGAALLNQKMFEKYGKVVLSDSAPRQYIIRAMTKRLGFSLANVTIVPLQPRKPFAGFEPLFDMLQSFDSIDIYNLSHCRDRARSASEVREINALRFERIVSIAHRLPTLNALIMVTDIGLVGDYPGRFSENWIEVGQTPFDEVDRSSLSIELACRKEESLPIVRARVGLVLDPTGMPSTLGYWSSASDIFVGFSSVLKRLPRFLTIPVASAKGALVPVTPADFAAETLICATERPVPKESALHVVMEPMPTVDAVLAWTSRRIGGARLRSGLPIDKVAKLGLIPGFREMARRNADQIASWWTPHRYCLSRNDVDTTQLRNLLTADYQFPKWYALENAF